MRTSVFQSIGSAVWTTDFAHGVFVTGSVFINYRRNDVASVARDVFFRLEREFPSEALFMDVEGRIKPGDDFSTVLQAEVAACDVLIVIIGPRWIELLGERKNERHDFVTFEIMSAFQQGKFLVPVLAEGTPMPRYEDLPESIRPLSLRHAVSIRSESFESDFKHLLTALRTALDAADQMRKAKIASAREESETRRAPLYKQRMKNFLIALLAGPFAIPQEEEIPHDPKLGQPDITLVQYVVAAAFVRTVLGILLLLAEGSVWMLVLALGDVMYGLLIGIVTTQHHLIFAVLAGALGAGPFYLFGYSLHNGEFPSIPFLFMFYIPPAVSLHYIRFYLLEFGFGKRRYIK